MKILILTLAFMTLVACFKPIHAEEFEFSLKHMSDHAADNEFRFTGWRGIEVKYQPSEESLYYFASSEEARVFMASPSFNMSFTGLGFGFKKPVSTNINIYGQIGYYFIKPDPGGRFKCEQGSCDSWESLYYGLNKKWISTHNHRVYFNEYEIKSSDAYGITIGTELIHPLTKDLNLNFGVEWRAMSFTVDVNGWYDNSVGESRVWESSFKGFSSTNYKVGLNYAF